jgi:hypothetical protein
MTAAADIAVYTDSGGLRVGANPLVCRANLEIHPDRLVFDSQWQIVLFRLSRVYTLPRSAITRICEGKKFIMRELRIEHTSDTHPSPLIFWPQNMAMLQKKLREFEFPVAT